MTQKGNAALYIEGESSKIVTRIGGIAEIIIAIVTRNPSKPSVCQGVKSEDNTKISTVTFMQQGRLPEIFWPLMTRNLITGNREMKRKLRERNLLDRVRWHLRKQGRSIYKNRTPDDWSLKSYYVTEGDKIVHTLHNLELYCLQQGWLKPFETIKFV